MGIPKYYALLVIFILCLLYFNCLLSKEIHDWTPSVKKQIILYILVWFLPVIGFFLANKFGNLSWFDKPETESGDSVISGGLLGLHSVFDPGVKHTIELIEKQKSGIHHEQKQANDKSENKENNT